MGEELIDGYFDKESVESNIHGYEWVSRENAISPFDFRLYPNPNSSVKIDVKSTCGEFRQIMHISIAELFEMRDSTERYDLYRVYALDEGMAKLRIAEDVKEFADGILESFDSLRPGVTVDAISVRPDIMNFGPEITITLLDPYDNDEEDDEA